MEHSVQLVQPWRTRALLASAVAAVELVLLVLAGSTLLGKTIVGEAGDAAVAHARTPVVAKEQTSTGVAQLARSDTSVVVLNGNGRSGAAAEAASRVRALEYTIGSVGNAQRSDYAATVVMYRQGFRAEAERLASDLGIKIVGPLDGMRPRELMGAHVALVVAD